VFRWSWIASCFDLIYCGQRTLGYALARGLGVSQHHSGCDGKVTNLIPGHKGYQSLYRLNCHDFAIVKFWKYIRDLQFAWQWRFRLQSCVLWHCMWWGRMASFQRTMLPPSSGWRWSSEMLVSYQSYMMSQPRRPKLHTGDISSFSSKAINNWSKTLW